MSWSGLALATAWTLLALHASPKAAAGDTHDYSEGPDLSVHAARPAYRWKLEVPLVATGVTAMLVGRNLATERQSVPSGGFQASDVHLGIDRRVLGHDETRAGKASDWLRDVSLTYPFVLRAVSARGDERFRSPLGVTLLYFESITIAESITGILKRTSARPRPYTYLPDSERPEDSQYDVNKVQAFQSFPSGHATASWCAVSTGIYDHLRSRPGASWQEHAAVGLVGGVLGTATSSLRVEAGQHFPSDVAAGAAIGIASSTVVSLLHHYTAGADRTAWPPRKSWLAALAGTAAGVGVGLATAEVLER